MYIRLINYTLYLDIDLRKDSGASSKSEVLRKAIALMRAATDAKIAGKPFGIGKSDESMEMKIVGI